ncbi:ferredoxin-NADPH reductase [Cellulomonas hominis]
MQRWISHDTLGTLLETVYRALMTNLLLIGGNAPFTVVLVATDLERTWPLLVVLAPLSFPTVVAVCAVFAERHDDLLRTFASAWRASLGKALALGALFTALVTVLVVDVRVLFGTTAGAVAIPVLVVGVVVVVAACPHAVVTLAQAPDARLKDVLFWSAYAALRRWYLTVVTLVVLGLLVAFVLSRPALGLGVAAAPMLYAVWANCRYSLRPAFVPTDGEPATA